MPQMNIVNVFTEYKGKLVSFVRKHLANVDDAEDIVQDIFYQIIRINDTAKPIEQTAAWLFRVAKNMIINYQKKKRPISFSAMVSIDGDDDDDLSDFIDIISANETTPETEILHSFVWEEIENALDELPEAQRDIFIQTEFLDMPIKEISQKTNIPVNTLLSRKHYAVVHLRKKLKELYSDFLIK
jgi:RNA polymerase sigma factor (sigma-70 family)